MRKHRLQLIRNMVAPAVAAAFFAGSVNHGHAADVIYGFAQQKLYNMSLSSHGGISGGAFSIISDTAASTSPPLLSDSHNGTFDSTQAQVGIVVPENQTGPAPAIPASPPATTVLIQANPTQPGAQNNTVNTAPVAGDFSPLLPNFARADNYTPSPVPNTNLGPELFPTTGSPGTLAIDTAAEALTDPTIANAISDMVISGSFNLLGAGTVDFDFDIIERIVAYSNVTSLPTPWSVNATNILTMDVKDSLGNSVFGIGANPSSTRTLFFANSNGGQTYNGNSIVTGHQLGNTLFQTPVLLAGAYTFSISATSKIDMNKVPEPSTYIMMGLASATISGVAYRRKQKAAKDVIA